MTERTISQCELCDVEDKANEFWARVQFRSSQYLFDDGTQDQDYNWTLCRECKLILINFMTDPGVRRRLLKAYKAEKKARKRARGVA